MNSSTRRLTLTGSAGAIEALQDAPAEGKPTLGTAVIAHPHPLFGGTMDNKVVQTLARAFVQAGWSAVRFNFRGVGRSDGAHDEGRGECEDFLAVVESVAPAGPLALAGFSFGAFVASHAVASLWGRRDMRKIVLVGTAASRFEVAPLPPDAHEASLIVHGEHDDTVALLSVLDWARPQSLPVTVVPGGGHFFHGQLPLLKNLVARHLRSLIASLHMIRLLRALAAPLLALFCVAALAQAPQAPEIAARSYLLLDVTADQLLAGRDMDSPVEPASLTKLMTAYLVFDALRSKKIDLKQTLPVSERAWRMPGSRMFIDPKMQVPVEDLIKGMIVQSGNDATVALAEGVAGSVERFVQLMNEQARALGMKATSYTNPEGLTETGHTTTARDLSVLATRLMRDFPDYVGYYAIQKYRYEGTPKANDTNRNLLLFRDPTVDGLKTGHTDAAGYCLIATARRDLPGVGTRRLLAIVLGAASEVARANEAQKLLNWGYTAFDAVKLYEAGQPVVEPPVWKGATKTIKLGRPSPIVVAVPAGMGGKLKTQVNRPDPLVAPYAKGQAVASLRVLAGDQPVRDIPLLVLEAVDEAGIFGRAWDALRLWIK